MLRDVRELEGKVLESQAQDQALWKIFGWKEEEEDILEAA